MAKKRGTRATYIPYGGREIKAIVDGKETGICQDKNGLYYYMYDDPKTGKRRKKTCTTDLKIAFNRFMQFVEAKRKEEYLQIENIQEKKSLKDNILSSFKEYYSGQNITIRKPPTQEPRTIITKDNVLIDFKDTPYSEDVLFDKTTEISEKEFFQWLENYRGKEEELKRKSGIAIKFLGKTDRATHINLSSILDFFEKNIKFKTDKTRNDYTKWCKHFFDFTELIYIDDITEDMVRNYEKEYLDYIRGKNNYTYKWKNDRANAIKKVLSFYAEKHPSTSTKVKNIREYLMIWDRTKDRKPLNPECISKEDFKLMYQNAGVRWKAILLMSLNTMSYAKDLSDMQTSHIDMKKKTLCMIREKEESLKVGYLWDETIKALQDYFKIKKSDSKWLFTSNKKDTAIP